MTTEPIRNWTAEYLNGTAPWDTGRPSCQLRSYLDDADLPCGAAVLEMGSGTGTNAIFLAEKGYRVTGVELTAEALSIARQRAKAAGVVIEWVHASALDPGIEQAFDLVFDRGCFHVFDPLERAKYVAVLEKITRSGSQVFLLCGNATEVTPGGPPVLHESEIRDAFAGSFEIDRIETFRLDTNTEGPGPLAWACRMRRR